MRSLRLVQKVIITLCLLLLTSCESLRESPTRYEPFTIHVEGTVTLYHSGAIWEAPGATVALYTYAWPSRVTNASTTTDHAGFYSLSYTFTGELPILSASLSGFGTQTAGEGSVPALRRMSRTQTINFQFELSLLP